MLISELFVRVGADVSGLERGMKVAQSATQRAGNSITGMGRNVTSATQAGTLNVNKLGGAFLTLASQATGVNPAVARLTNVLGAFAFSSPVMIGVLAGITAVSVGWRFWTKDAREAAEATEKLGNKYLEMGKAAVAASVPGLEADRAKLNTAFSDAIARRDRAQGRSILESGEQTKGLLQAREDVARLSAELLSNEQAIAKAKAAYDKMLVSGQSLGGIVGQAATDYEKATEKINAALSKRLDAQVELVLAMEKEANFGFDKKAIGVGTGAGDILPTGMVTNLDAMKATLKDLPDLARLTTDHVFQLGADAEVAADKFAFLGNSVLAFADVGAAAIVGFATGAATSMHDFVESALAELSRLIAKLVIIKILKAAFAGSTGGFGAFVLSSLEGRASGGPVRAGGAYMVGERGPEMFVPSSSGSIVPNGGAATVVLPSMPRPMSPSEAAMQAWFIEAIRIVTRNNVERG